jgi:guanine nucleotide-binding protein subunit alpha
MSSSQPDEVTKILHACHQDLLDLWRDPAVREILRKKKVKLEEGPGL